MQQLLATERLEGSPDELYSCLGCQTKTTAKIKKKFLNTPAYLILHIKRFEEKDQQFQKNKKPMEYPFAFDMDE